MHKLVANKVSERDREQVRNLTRKSHSETIFSEIPFSERKFDRSFDYVLNEPENYLGLKVSLGPKILGCSYCMLGGYYIGEGAKVVTVNSIYVDQDVRNGMLGGKVTIKLVRGIELWARSKKANVILYHVTSGRNISSIDKFFRKAGMTTLGGNYGVRL